MAEFEKTFSRDVSYEGEKPGRPLFLFYQPREQVNILLQHLAGTGIIHSTLGHSETTFVTLRKRRKLVFNIRKPFLFKCIC